MERLGIHLQALSGAAQRCTSGTGECQREHQPTQLDDSESFLYAETFKYLYLIFADPKVLDLDRYVLNTEAHPFEVDRPDKAGYRRKGSRWGRKKGFAGDRHKDGVPMPAFSGLPGLEMGRRGIRGEVMGWLTGEVAGLGRQSEGKRRLREDE